MEQERLPYMCQARGCDGCTVCKGEEMKFLVIGEEGMRSKTWLNPRYVVRIDDFWTDRCQVYTLDGESFTAKIPGEKLAKVIEDAIDKNVEGEEIIRMMTIDDGCDDDV